MADESLAGAIHNISETDEASSQQTPDRSNAADIEVLVFQPGDPENPRNWPQWRKWWTVGVIVLIDLTVSWGASGFSPASAKFAKDFHVSPEVATLGLSMYVLGLAFGPMTLAPLSEYYGRMPIYVISYAVFLIFLIGTYLAETLAVFIVLRLLSGLFCSVTIANFGGTIADLFEPHETGIPMSFFLWAATFGSPSGYFIFSFVAQDLPWRDIFRVLFLICAPFWVLMTVTLSETRHSVLLLRRAVREKREERKRREGEARLEILEGLERRERGNDAVSQFLMPQSLRQGSPKQLFTIALTRPFRFLFSEAIIQFAALYNGYLYGLSFLFNGAFNLVFGKEGHGFDILGVGLTFLGIMVGISFGPFTNLWQERYYQRAIAASGGKDIPEARVQLSKVAAITFPISLLWFAWTTYTNVHWIVPILASALWGWSFYTLILMSYTYTVDSYKVFSASALAGICLIRNIAGAGFPLLGHYFFKQFGNQWAGTLLSILAVLLAPIPFVLSKHGRALRPKSPWAREHMDDLTDEETATLFERLRGEGEES